MRQIPYEEISSITPTTINLPNGLSITGVVRGHEYYENAGYWFEFQGSLSEFYINSPEEPTFWTNDPIFKVGDRVRDTQFARDTTGIVTFVYADIDIVVWELENPIFASFRTVTDWSQFSPFIERVPHDEHRKA